MIPYRCIMLDPPWPEHGGGKVKRGADRWYKLKKVAEIPPLIMEQALWRPDVDGCHVWLWSPAWRVAVGQAADVLRAIGARPVRKFTWVKPSLALGQYGRGAHEDLVLGIIGRLPQLETGRKVRDVLECDGPLGDNGKRIHSAKPPEMYERVSLVSPGRRAAIFERMPRPGFDTSGHMRDDTVVDIARWLDDKSKHIFEVRRAA